MTVLTMIIALAAATARFRARRPRSLGVERYSRMPCVTLRICELTCGRISGWGITVVATSAAESRKAIPLPAKRAL